MIFAPNSRSMPATVLFPVAIPPVKPTNFTLSVMAETSWSCKKALGFAREVALIFRCEAPKSRRDVSFSGGALCRAAALSLFSRWTVAHHELARGARARARHRLRAQRARHRRRRPRRDVFSQSDRMVSRRLGEYLHRRADSAGLRVEH